jgi:SEC-C motif-containing protein
VSDCFCGRPLPYAQCCGPYVEDFAGRPAPDAEALMRSRYSAFVLGRADYLRSTWHESKRPSKISFDLGVKWLGLEVRDVRVIDASHAEVEFVARQRDTSGRAVRLHERSRFVQETGRWYYLDGDWK